MSTSLRAQRVRVDEGGFSLVETMIALGLLLVVAAGVLPLGILAIRISENNGHLMARTTEYSHDKLEQLMSLAYGDVVSDTRVFPATVGGSGLSPGGSLDSAAPSALYVDYLDIRGALLPATADGSGPASWYYQRLWRVEEMGAADANCPTTVSVNQRCLKRLTVTTTVRSAAQGGNGMVPRATVTALKTYPF